MSTSIHWAGASLRFQEHEFKALSTYGHVDGANLLDWPITLQDLEPYYDLAEKKLGVTMGETTPDGLFTLQQCECLGACADAPVMLVNDRTMCSFMDNDKLDQLVDGLKAAEGQA